MKALRCLIIEDEPLAAEVLVDHIAAISTLQLEAVCGDAIKAMNVLNEKDIDLIFLDLHLPRIKGFDFLKSLPSTPKIIVTTAYQEYALEGYEYDVIDYLLKPIEFPRFLKAIQKMAYLEKKNNTANSPEQDKENDFLFFNVAKKKVKVFLHEIEYIESLRDYVRIHQTEQSILSKLPIGALEQQLPKGRFLRIHRSFIINTRRIKTYDAISVELGEQRIPIGRNYRKVFEQFCSQLSGISKP